MVEKGDKSRRTLLPSICMEDLKKQIEFAQHQVEADRILNKAGVYLPGALSQKFPTAEIDLKWQYDFFLHRFFQRTLVAERKEGIIFRLNLYSALSVKQVENQVS